jgi:hypothetical protein
MEVGADEEENIGTLKKIIRLCADNKKTHMAIGRV